MAPANPIDYFAIQNTISRYCLALDTKDFDLLKDVFTPDVVGNYPFNPDLKGVEILANTIKKRYVCKNECRSRVDFGKLTPARLTPITSQHALTTQTIEVGQDGKTATAVTYFTGIHFGKGKWQGQQVTAWGRYNDKLVLVEGEAGLPGASGKWLISSRDVMFMGRLGEERVMDGE